MDSQTIATRSKANAGQLVVRAREDLAELTATADAQYEALTRSLSECIALLESAAVRLEACPRGSLNNDRN